MASGRAPALSERGRLLLTTAGLLLLAGALASSWSLAALGLALVTMVAVLWLGFFPSAVMVWRRHVEMSWSVSGHAGSDATSVGLVAGRPFGPA